MVGPAALGTAARGVGTGGGVCGGGDERVLAGRAEAAAVGELDDSASATPAADRAERGAGGVPPGGAKDRQVRKADHAEIDERVEEEAAPDGDEGQ